MSYIELNNVTKKIKNNVVLNNVNLMLDKGKIYGFVGENGSGKTMLLRTISGLLKPKGSVIINGINIYTHTSDQSIGIILENIGLWDNLSAFDNLKLLNKFSDIKISDDDINSAICAVGLDQKSKKPFRKFSLGMKQKLCIAQAIMSKPDILIFDEPTNALDENSILSFREIIINEKQRGATILIASHLKEDISVLCDTVLKINNGSVEEIDNEKKI